MTVMRATDLAAVVGEYFTDISNKTIDMAAAEQAAVDAVRAVAGQVDGPGDPLWGLQVDIARQVIALGGLSVAELDEWRAVVACRESMPEPVLTAPEMPEPVARPAPTFPAGSGPVETPTVAVVESSAPSVGPTPPPRKRRTGSALGRQKLTAQEFIETYMYQHSPNGEKVPRSKILAAAEKHGISTAALTMGRKRTRGITVQTSGSGSGCMWWAEDAEDGLGSAG